MRLLVAGGDRVDAGKTTFSTGLVRRVSGTGFKPRAGNDYWFDHDDYRRAVEAGRLYGKDAKRLAAASAADVAPEEINPVHRLWRPAPGPGDGLLGAAHRRFLVDRVGEAYVVNAAADLPTSASENLPLADAVGVDSLPAFNEVMRERHLPALAALRARVAECERAVVESYADVADPFDGVEVGDTAEDGDGVRYDAVAVAEPGRVRVYDGGAYLDAASVEDDRSHTGRLEVTVERVTATLDPAATVRLPALGAEQRTNPAAVADAYEVAYDALLAAALGPR